jgi:acyl-CoA thioesterase
LWTPPPRHAAPEDCPPLPFIRADAGDLHTYLDVRLDPASLAERDGRLVWWVRAPDADVCPAAFLAVVADYLPEAIHFNLGRPAGAVSLDNTLRIVRTAPAEWLLCQTQLSAIGAGVFHGRVEIFTPDGRLMAIGAQSGLVRDIGKA